MRTWEWELYVKNPLTFLISGWRGDDSWYFAWKHGLTVATMNQTGLPPHLLDVCSTQTFSFVGRPLGEILSVPETPRRLEKKKKTSLHSQSVINWKLIIESFTLATGDLSGENTQGLCCLPSPKEINQSIPSAFYLNGTMRTQSGRWKLKIISGRAWIINSLRCNAVHLGNHFKADLLLKSVYATFISNKVWRDLIKFCQIHPDSSDSWIDALALMGKLSATR